MPKKETPFVWTDAEILRIIAYSSDQSGADAKTIVRMFEELQLADMPEGALPSGLKRLMKAGLIRRDGRRHFINSAGEGLPRTKSGKFSSSLGRWLRLLGVVPPWVNANVTIEIHRED